MDSEHEKKSMVLARQLAVLREQFRAGLPQRLAAMRDTARVALEPERFDPVRLGELRRQAHSLAGAAGTFGHAALSEAALRLELAIIPYLASAAPPAAQVIDGLTALLDAVARIASAPEPGRTERAPKSLGIGGMPRVLVVEDDAELARAISDQFDLHGYAAEVYSNLAEFETALTPGEDLPAAIIMDVILPEGEAAGIQAIAELRQRSVGTLPVIFVSVRDDMAARLAAQRAGASRYLLKPLDLDDLVRVVEGVAQRDAPRPYRVLLVDDEAEVLGYHTALLEAAGMQVEALTDPMRAHAAALRFQPDCLVLDLYMPGCGGVELATVLRADARFLDTPILFLSVEGDEERQIHALDMGGDAFLRKPVEPRHLVGAIAARARRARELRRLNDDLRAALRENRVQRQALDQHAIVSITDAAGTIAYANERFCQASGYRRSELLGEHHRIVKSAQHPPAFHAALWQTISRGDIWRGEICNRRKDGRLYWVECTIVPFLDESGTPSRYISVCTEITALKEAERDLKLAKEQAERASQAKSDFLSGMSHALRTPLNAMLGFAQLLAADPAVGPEQREPVRQILHAGQHLLERINAMLDQARVEAGRQPPGQEGG